MADLFVEPTPIIGHAASAVIVNDQNQVLLLLRDDYPVWVNPGGNVDNDEDFVSAVHREVKEETDITIILTHEPFDYFSPVSDGYRHEQVFRARPADNRAPRLGNEGLAVQWHHIDALPENVPPRHRQRIIEVFHQTSPRNSVYSQISMADFAATLDTRLLKKA